MTTLPDQLTSASVGAATTTTQQVVINNPTDWALAQLAYMGYPDTQSNVNFLVGWQQLEGGNWNNTAAYNPLNTTLQMGSRSNPINGVGVQAYGSWGQGLQATAQTLAAYPAITQALAAGNASQANAQGALSADLAKWSGGGYGAVPAPGGSSPTQTVLTSSVWSRVKKAIGTSIGSVIAGPTAGGAVGSATNPLSGLKAIGTFFSDLSKPQTWVRIAEVVGGVIVLGLGVVMLGRAMGAGAAVAGVAGIVGSVPGVNTTPVGGVLRAGSKTATRYQTAKTTQARQQASAQRTARAEQRRDELHQQRVKALQQQRIDDRAYRQSRGSARENRAAYNRHMDTSDLRRRTA